VRVWQPQVSPYRTPLTNLLGCLAQYQILSVYLAVLLVNGEKSMQALGFTEFGVGLALVGLNSLVLVLAVGAGQRQFLAAEAEKARRMKKVSMSTQGKHVHTMPHLACVPAIPRQLPSPR